MENTVTTVWKKGVLFETDNPSGETVFMDTKTEDKPQQEGLSPKAMMLSSLAGCSGLDIVSILEKKRSKYDDFKIITTGKLTEDHPKYYNEVDVEYHFYGSELNEGKINRAVELSVERYCGVMEMFRRFAKIKTTIILHNK